MFPKLILTGYIPLKGYDQLKKRALSEVAARVVDDALPTLMAATKGRRAAMTVGFMEPTSMRHEMHNSVALIQDGAVLKVYRKMHLPVEENHYFVPGDEVVVEINGDAISYVVTRNINYTNIYSYHCSFCAFSKGKAADSLRGRPIFRSRKSNAAARNLSRRGEMNTLRE